MQHITNITIVEDDFLIADFIQSTLKNIGYHIVDICNSYNSCIASINNFLPDIILIDIKIEGEKNGIDIAEYIRANKDLPFIFISSLSDRKTIDKAKKTLPSAYLIKPFEEEDLYAVIEVALVNHAQRKPGNQSFEGSLILQDSIFIKQKQTYIKVKKSEIFYLEAKDNYVKIYTPGNSFLIRQTINEIQQSLPPCFYRIHRSFIVNLNFIHQIQYEEILLTDNTRLPLSRSIYAGLIESLQVLKP